MLTASDLGDESTRRSHVDSIVDDICISFLCKTRLDLSID